MLNQQRDTKTAEQVLPDQLALALAAGVGGVEDHLFPSYKSSNLTGKELSFAILNRLSLVAGYEQALNTLTQNYSGSKGPFVVSFINAHCFNLCFTDPLFRSAVLRSDLIFRDGKGMEILCKSMGVDPGVNMCGTDTIPLMLEQFKEKRFALFGTEEPYLSKAAAVLTGRGTKVILSKTGFYSIDEYVEWVDEQKPEVVVLGMGMPKQELVSAALLERITHKCLIINGGAIIDHLGQKLSRAPMWMRARGLEWLYRLVQEPGRLFKRYVVGNVMFLSRVFAAAKRIRL
jgi:exopolysaccharide biosynthesis WecB/TagA/CpsF family protein